MTAPLKYTDIQVDDYIKVLHEQRVPEDMRWLLYELFTQMLDGRNSLVMYCVDGALSQPLADFNTYVQKTTDSGIWNYLVE